MDDKFQSATYSGATYSASRGNPNQVTSPPFDSRPPVSNQGPSKLKTETHALKSLDFRSLIQQSCFKKVWDNKKDIFNRLSLQESKKVEETVNNPYSRPWQCNPRSKIIFTNRQQKSYYGLEKDCSQTMSTAHNQKYHGSRRSRDNNKSEKTLPKKHCTSRWDMIHPMPRCDRNKRKSPPDKSQWKNKEEKREQLQKSKEVTFKKKLDSKAVSSSLTISSKVSEEKGVKQNEIEGKQPDHSKKPLEAQLQPTGNGDNCKAQDDKGIELIKTAFHVNFNVAMPKSNEKSNSSCRISSSSPTTSPYSACEDENSEEELPQDLNDKIGEIKSLLSSRVPLQHVVKPQTDLVCHQPNSGNPSSKSIGSAGNSTLPVLQFWFKPYEIDFESAMTPADDRNAHVCLSCLSANRHMNGKFDPRLQSRKYLSILNSMPSCCLCFKNLAKIRNFVMCSLPDEPVRPLAKEDTTSVSESEELDALLSEKGLAKPTESVQTSKLEYENVPKSPPVCNSPVDLPCATQTTSGSEPLKLPMKKRLYSSKSLGEIFAPAKDQEKSLPGTQVQETKQTETESEKLHSPPLSVTPQTSDHANKDLNFSATISENQTSNADNCSKDDSQNTAAAENRPDSIDNMSKTFKNDDCKTAPDHHKSLEKSAASQDTEASKMTPKSVSIVSKDPTTSPRTALSGSPINVDNNLHKQPAHECDTEVHKSYLENGTKQNLPMDICGNDVYRSYERNKSSSDPTSLKQVDKIATSTSSISGPLLVESQTSIESSDDTDVSLLKYAQKKSGLQAERPVPEERPLIESLPSTGSSDLEKQFCVKHQPLIYSDLSDSDNDEDGCVANKALCSPSLGVSLTNEFLHNDQVTNMETTTPDFVPNVKKVESQQATPLSELNTSTTDNMSTSDQCYTTSSSFDTSSPHKLFIVEDIDDVSVTWNEKSSQDKSPDCQTTDKPYVKQAHGLSKIGEPITSDSSSNGDVLPLTISSLDWSQPECLEDELPTLQTSTNCRKRVFTNLLNTTSDTRPITSDDSDLSGHELSEMEKQRIKVIPFKKRKFSNADSDLDVAKGNSPVNTDRAAMQLKNHNDNYSKMQQHNASHTKSPENSINKDLGLPSCQADAETIQIQPNTSPTVPDESNSEKEVSASEFTASDQEIYLISEDQHETESNLPNSDARLSNDDSCEAHNTDFTLRNKETCPVFYVKGRAYPWPFQSPSLTEIEAMSDTDDDEDQGTGHFERPFVFLKRIEEDGFAPKCFLQTLPNHRCCSCCTRLCCATPWVSL